MSGSGCRTRRASPLRTSRPRAAPCGTTATARIDGVPGTHAPIPIDFIDVAGSSCGALLPTGHAVDTVEGVTVTCIDNGMPVVCVAAADLGVSGHESPAELEADTDAPLAGRGHPARRRAADEPGRRHERHRAEGQPAEPRPARRRRRHPDIHPAPGARGDRGARSRLGRDRLPHPGLGRQLASPAPRPGRGSSTSSIPAASSRSSSTSTRASAADVVVRRAALLRTARLLMRGEVLVPGAVWTGTATP